MRHLTLTPREYEPPSLCHTGIETMFALAAAEAATAVTAGATAAGVVGAGAGTATALAGAAAGATAAGTAGLTAATTAAGIGTGLGIGMPSLSTLGTVASVGGTLLQAKAGMDQAEYQAAMSKAEAEALKQKANEDASAGQRAAITKERQAELVLSRARAMAAASGTEATSPDIVNALQGIDQQGSYNALSALYEGQARARSDLYQADIELFKRRRTLAAAPLAMGGTLLSGLGSLTDSRLRRNYLLNSGTL